MTDFHEGDKVIILEKNIVGEIIDISYGDDGTPYYKVESDIPGAVDDPDACPGNWPAWDCLAEQIQKV